jgi:hypothetical protein
MSVLVVASEILIGIHAETVLVALGLADVRIVTVGRALEQPGDEVPELAVLDADLGAPVFSLAWALRARGTPVIFLGIRSDLPAEWADAPVVAKPLEHNDLSRIVALILTPQPTLERNTS